MDSRSFLTRKLLHFSAAVITISSYCLLATTAHSAPVKVRWHKLHQSKPGLYDIAVSYPEFRGSSPLARAASAAFKLEALKDLGEFRKAAADDAHEFGKLRSEYGVDRTTQLGVVSDTVISGYLVNYDYSGGAHPNTIYVPITYGLVDGKPARLSVRQIASPSISPAEVLAKAVIPKINAIKKQNEGDPIGSIDMKYANRFIVTKSGITWVFSPYDIGAYAEGPFIIDVPWSDLRGLLRTAGPLAAYSK